MILVMNSQRLGNKCTLRKLKAPQLNPAIRQVRHAKFNGAGKAESLKFKAGMLGSWEAKHRRCELKAESRDRTLDARCWMNTKDEKAKSKIN